MNVVSHAADGHQAIALLLAHAAPVAMEAGLNIVGNERRAVLCGKDEVAVQRGERLWHATP
jgi:hypothetical protein